eukprot:tig00000237_g20486.t1
MLHLRSLAPLAAGWARQQPALLRIAAPPVPRLPAQHHWVQQARWVTTPQPPKPISIVDIQDRKRKGVPITMVTAYDYPSAVHVDSAGFDILLVGDSVGMVQLGYDTTLPVTMDEMLHHCRSVARGARRPLLVGDMPFGSYEVSEDDAVRNAIRFLKEGEMDAVKLEGGVARAATVARVVRSGVAVMGHVGLTPQSISVLGGFRSQGRSAAAAKRLLDDARALQEAGAFAVVVECVPEGVARAITAALEIPTVGIGAGAGTDGQVLVYHDLVGLYQHPHHAKVTPKFSKRFGNAAAAIQSALEAYRAEVVGRKFPSAEYSPYTIPQEELDEFLAYAARPPPGLAPAPRPGPGPAAGTPDETIKVY